MKAYAYDAKTICIRLIDVQSFIETVVEPNLSEDCQKYNLAKNNRLLRQFIVYRITSHLLELLSGSDLKTVFVLNSNIKISLFEGCDLFATNTFRKLVDLLSLNFLKTKSFSECVYFINTITGEGKEIRNTLSGIILSNKKNINFNKFNKFLEKYKIHKIQGELKQNFKVKLGLFVT